MLERNQTLPLLLLGDPGTSVSVSPSSICRGITASGISVNAAKLLLSEICVGNPDLLASIKPFLDNPHYHFNQGVNEQTNNLISFIRDTCAKFPFLVASLDGGSDRHRKEHLLVVTIHYPGGCFVLRPQVLTKPNGQKMAHAFLNAMKEVGIDSDKIMFCVVDGASVNSVIIKCVNEYLKLNKDEEATCVNPSLAGLMTADPEEDDDEGESCTSNVLARGNDQFVVDAAYLGDIGRIAALRCAEMCCLGHLGQMGFVWAVKSKKGTCAGLFENICRFSALLQYSFANSFLRYDTFRQLQRNKIASQTELVEKLTLQLEFLEKACEIAVKAAADNGCDDEKQMQQTAQLLYCECIKALSDLFPELDEQTCTTLAYDLANGGGAGDLAECGRALFPANDGDDDDESEEDDASKVVASVSRTCFKPFLSKVMDELLSRPDDKSPRRILSDAAKALCNLRDEFKNLLQFAQETAAANKGNAPVFQNATRWARKSMGSFHFIAENWEAIVRYIRHFAGSEEKHL